METVYVKIFFLINFLIKNDIMIHLSKFRLIDRNEELSAFSFISKVLLFSELIDNCTDNKQELILCIYERSVNNIIIPFSIWNSENIYLPINTSTPLKKLTSIIEEHNVKIIISDSFNIQKFEIDKLDLKLINIDDYNTEIKCKKSNSITKLNFNVENIAYCIFTSGSTGKPKGVQIKFSSFLSRIEWQKKTLNNNHKSFFIHKTPTSFDVSLWEILLPVYCDSSVYVCDEKESIHPILLNSIINKYGVTDIHFIPSMLHNFLNFNKVPPKSILNIICSGEELKPYHFKLLNDCSTLNLWNFYGPTETTIDVLYYNVNLDFDYVKIPLGQCVVETNYKLLIHDKNNSSQSTYKLLISGNLLSPGYLNDDLLTNQKYYPLDGILYYDTGDLVTISDNEIYFHSRVDNQIKLNGVRIEINEIENALSKCLNNTLAIVVPIKTDGNKIVLSAFINCNRRKNEFLFQNFIKYLDSAFFPKSILYSNTIPRLSNGKVNLKFIKERLIRISND